MANGLPQLASMVASLLLMPLLVEGFGIVNYGLFMLTSSVSAYAGLLDLGVGAALTKMVAEYTAKKDSASLSSVISSALLFYSVVGVVVAIVMGIIGFFIGDIVRVDAEGALLLRGMIWVGAIAQLWYWPASTARHVLAGLQRFDVLAKTGLVATVLSIGAAVAVLLAGRGPLLLVGLNAVITSAVAAVNVVLAMRLVKLGPLSLTTASRRALKAIFLFSWAVFVVEVSDSLFYQQTDRVLLGILAGASAVGLYEAAAKFNVLVTFLSGLTISAVLPLASSMSASGRSGSLRSLLLRGTKYGVALIAPITVVAMVFARPLINVWLGPTFADMALVAQVLLFPHILVSSGLMGDAIVVSQGRMARRIPYIFAQALFNVVLSIVLIPRFGIIGAAIGTAVAHLVDFPFHIWFLAKMTGTPVREWLREIALPVYPLLVVPLAIGLILVRTSLQESIIGIVAAGMAALLGYWLAFYFVGMRRYEREDVRMALRVTMSRQRP